MTGAPHHVLAMAYRDNLVTFTQALQGQVRQSKTVNPDLARPAVAEMRRSFDQMRQYHQTQMSMLDARPRTHGTHEEDTGMKQELWSLPGLSQQSRLIASTCLVALGYFGCPAYGQGTLAGNSPQAAASPQALKTNQTKMGGEEEVAHPFLTHMGVPEAVGVYSLRLGALGTRAEGRTDGDFAFHFETGLTQFIGLHVRNDMFRDRPRTEAMFQFAAVRSKNGMSGFSPLIEFEIPTRSFNGSRINTLVGFSTALTHSRVAFNQVVHYNPREDMVDGSASLVWRVDQQFYPVVELLGEARRGERPIVNVLAGLKVRVNNNLLLGFALQVPATSNKEFSSQLIVQPDIEWGRAR